MFWLETKCFMCMQVFVYMFICVNSVMTEQNKRAIMMATEHGNVSSLFLLFI